MLDRAGPWPSFFRDPGAPLRDVVAGLDRSQHWSAAELLRGQQHQLAGLVRWAVARAPHYGALAAQAEALVAAVDDPKRFWARWRALPLVAKAELRQAGQPLNARVVPPAHQPVTKLSTSGSTGTPVELRATRLTALIWDALSVREHLWQGRDFRKRLGVIRFQPPATRAEQGHRRPGWGPPVEKVYATGPASVIHIGLPVAALAAWLLDFAPHYLLASPSVVAALLDHLPAPPPALEELRSAFEPLDPELETRVSAQWGARCSEIYSSNEVGLIAFRCREAGRLHVQSESVLVEILDELGQPCAPGQTGRVIVTSLHNFATPLLRYDLGDYATAGGACACGRGSPTIERVRGRVRNLARRPDGTSFWPVSLMRIGTLAPIRQFQYVQTAPDAIELRLVLDRAMSAEEEAGVCAAAQDLLGYPYRVSIVAVAALERAASGKFEEFLSQL